MDKPSSSFAPPAAVGGSSEFAFTDSDFEQIRALIHRYAGISLGPTKRDMVYSRLARRLRAGGDASFSAYLARLAAGDAEEMEGFVNALTTNVTAFFREAHHFDTLAQWLRGRPRERPVRIWCSACSTGEEAYSLAITLLETLGGGQAGQILASDLSTRALEQARQGVFEPERAAGLSPERMGRFFQRETGGRLRVRPELQRMIEFRRINLLDSPWPVRGPLDAIFCRNVMIYFDKPTQYAILRRFAPLLRPEGLLFAGHSETFPQAADLFRPRGYTVYEPVAGTAA